MTEELYIQNKEKDIIKIIDDYKDDNDNIKIIIKKSKKINKQNKSLNQVCLNHTIKDTNEIK